MSGTWRAKPTPRPYPHDLRLGDVFMRLRDHAPILPQMEERAHVRATLYGRIVGLRDMRSTFEITLRPEAGGDRILVVPNGKPLPGKVAVYRDGMVVTRR